MKGEPKPEARRANPEIRRATASQGERQPEARRANPEIRRATASQGEGQPEARRANPEAGRATASQGEPKPEARRATLAVAPREAKQVVGTLTVTVEVTTWVSKYVGGDGAGPRTFDE